MASKNSPRLNLQIGVYNVVRELNNDDDAVFKMSSYCWLALSRVTIDFCPLLTLQLKTIS